MVPFPNTFNEQHNFCRIFSQITDQKSGMKLICVVFMHHCELTVLPLRVQQIFANFIFFNHIKRSSQERDEQIILTDQSND